MNMEITENEREFNTVKRSLDSLGYKGQLSLESSPLVNRILCDLLKATKSFRNMKIENGKLKEELKVQGDLVLPLRNENLKLAKENNELHKYIIKVKDEIDISNNSNDSSVKKMKSTNEELTFLLTQKNATIKSLETQIENLRLKLNELFNQLYMGQGDKSRVFVRGLPKADQIIAHENPNQINATFKKPSFDLSSRLEVSADTNYNNVPSSVALQAYKDEILAINNGKSEWAKDLKIAESKEDKLRQRVKELSDEKNDILLKMDTLEKGIKTRDQEIKRLQEDIYLGDEHKEEIKIKYRSEFMDLQNQKLLIQIDFLNKENHRLQAIDYFHNHRCRQEEVNRLDDQITNLNKENEKLKKALEKCGLNDKNLNTSQFRKGTSRLSSSGLFGGPSLRSQIDNLKKDKADLVRLLEEERQKVQSITKELMESRDEFNSKTITLNKEKEELMEKYEKLKCEITGAIQKKNESIDDELKQDLNELKKLDEFGNEQEENTLIENSKANEIIKNKNKEIEELKKTYSNKITQQLAQIDKLQKENNSLKEELSKAKREAERLKKELEEKSLNKKDNLNESKELQNIKKEIVKKDDEISKLKFELKKKDLEIERCTNELSKQKDENELLTNKSNLLQSEVEQRREEILELQKDKNDMISNHSLNQSALEKKNKNLEKENSSLKIQLANSKIEDDKILRDDLSNLSKSNTERGNKIEKLEKDKAKLLKNLKIFQDENLAASEHIKKLENQIKQLGKIQEELIKKLTKYEPENYKKSETETVE